MIKIINKKNKGLRYWKFTSWIYYDNQTTYINSNEELDKKALKEFIKIIIDKYGKNNALDELIYTIDSKLYGNDKITEVKLVNNNFINEIIKENKK